MLYEIIIKVFLHTLNILLSFEFRCTFWEIPLWKPKFVFPYTNHNIWNLNERFGKKFRGIHRRDCVPLFTITTPNSERYLRKTNEINKQKYIYKKNGTFKDILFRFGIWGFTSDVRIKNNSEKNFDIFSADLLKFL